MTNLTESVMEKLKDKEIIKSDSLAYPTRGTIGITYYLFHKSDLLNALKETEKEMNKIPNQSPYITKKKCDELIESLGSCNEHKEPLNYCIKCIEEIEKEFISKKEIKSILKCQRPTKGSDCETCYYCRARKRLKL